jgi:hypothetical protein
MTITSFNILLFQFTYYFSNKMKIFAVVAFCKPSLIDYIFNSILDGKDSNYHPT